MASVGRSNWYGDGAWGSEVCGGLERCGGNGTSVLGRWGRGERAGMREAASRVVLAGKRGSREGAEREQQWSNSGRAAVCQGMADARWGSSMSLNTTHSGTVRLVERYASTATPVTTKQGATRRDCCA